MKYALFEFGTEKTCEVGETRWILREDPGTFKNADWDCEKEVMVSWPRDFSKVHKRIIKGSIDPMSLETTTYVAKVLEFSDDYGTIHHHMIMVRYCKTGSLLTPKHAHGRGKRVIRPNEKYANSEDEDEEPSQQVIVEKAAKRPKKNATKPPGTSTKEMNALIEKYNLTKENDNQDEEYEDDDISCQFGDVAVENLKKENHYLKKKLEKKEQEIEHLKHVITNLKGLPSLADAVISLKEQVNVMKLVANGQKYPLSGLSKSSPATSSSAPSTPRSSSSSSGSDVEPEMISLCSNITLTKGQTAGLKSKANLKDFVYAIMGMLWTRDVLCTHSITGRVSNTFKEKDAKPQLDAEKVQSICEYAAKRYGCKEPEVRHVMTARINNVIKVEKAKQRLSS